MFASPTKCPAPGILFVLGLFGTSGTHATGAQFRSYLSVNGSDTNPCTLTQPCRLLPAALAATQSAGEVWILDSGNFNIGAVPITQSVSILAVPGATSSFVANNADAIDITGSSISVTLRNVAVTSISGSSNLGVNLTGTNSQLNIDNSQFYGLATAVQVNAGGAQLNAFNSTFRNNTYALYLNGTTATGAIPAQAIVDRCTISNTANHGIQVFYASVMVAHNKISSLAPATNYGVWAGEGANVMLESNLITQFQFAVALDGNAKVTSTVSNTFVDNQFTIYDPNGNYSNGTHL